MIKFLKEIKKLFAKDLHWKILSVLIAVALWFVVMNLSNPTETKTFVTKLTFDGEQTLEDLGYTVLDKAEILDTPIEVKVTGTRPALDDLKSSTTLSSVSAVADLSSITINDEMDFPQNFVVKVTPRVTESYVYSYDITNYNPTVVNISIDKLSSSKRTLTVKAENKPASGFVADVPQCDVDNVTVWGALTRMSEISKIQAVVDLTDKNATFTETVKLQAYDSEGHVLDGFKIEPESVDVTVAIMSIGTIRINEPQTIGDLPEGLKLDSIEWSPKMITVTGKTSELEKLASVNLPPIDLSEISASEERTFGVRELLNNSALSSNTSSINVKINVSAADDESEEVAAQLDVPASKVTINGLDTEKYTCTIDSIDIELSGDADTIDGLTADEAEPTINVSDLSEGKHTVTVNLSLPDGVIAVRNSAVIVISGDDDEAEKADETANANSTSGSQSDTGTVSTTAAPPAEHTAETTTQPAAEASAEEETQAAEVFNSGDDEGEENYTEEDTAVSD